ncbi:ankyrin repeat-containing protein NPR4-like [Pistacia vera]|uniref:ankyrin repeat-containing protein NPR4-like n=1 Tax=Pistacia vera TaxID=55513 RepID=UPI001262FB1C|nr:ankyrin repeat-containing protein NPR4-like [Pistacia vera]
MTDYAAASGCTSTEEKVEIVIAAPNKKMDEFNVNVPVDSSTIEEETVLLLQNSISFSKEIERRSRHFKLYRAALEGDWNTAEKIYKEEGIDIPVKLSKDGGTALHISAAAGHTGFVKKLLEKMNKEDLAVKNNAGNTAFFLAVASERVEIVRAMMKKNEDIVKIRGDNDILPLHKAALIGDKEMVEYLYEATADVILDHDNDRIELLISLINRSWYDAALHLVERHPQIALARDKNEETALHRLARLPVLTRVLDLNSIEVCKKSAIYLYNEVKRDVTKRCQSMLGMQRVKERNKLSLRDQMNEREQQMNEKRQSRTKRLGWRHRVYEAKRQVHYTGQEIPDSAFELVECLWKQVMLLVLDDCQILEIIRKPRSLIFEAAKQGNLRFLDIIFSRYPDLMFEVDENNYTILHVAVMYRRRNIFNAMYHIGPFKDLVVRDTDKEGNNILHLAAKLPPVDTPDIESPALPYKMEREMWWFEGVKRILHPVVAEAKNNEEKTPRALFTEQHKELREKAEKWTKDNATACIMASTIITTVVFAALFTVPGGTNENIGTPIFLRRASFIVFAISDTIALLLSSSSITMFVSVISSRCEEADFHLRRITNDLALGVNLLLYSVEAMMVVFSATMFIVFKDGWLWVPVLLTVMVVFSTLMNVGKTWTVGGEVLHYVNENSEYIEDGVLAAFKLHSGRGTGFVVKGMTETSRLMEVVF